MKILSCTLILAALSLPIGAAGPVPDAFSSKPLRLAVGEIDPLQLSGREAGLSSTASVAASGGAQVRIVQFHEGVPSTFEGWDDDVRVLSLGHLPGDGLLVRLSDAQADRIASRPEVRWVGVMPPQWRLSPDVRAERARLSATESEPLDLELSLWRGSQRADVLAELNRMGADTVLVRTADVGNTRVLFQLLEDQLIELLTNVPDIEWIEPAPKLTRRNATSSWIIQSNSNGAYPVWNQGLHGEGEIIGHLDGEIDMNSCFFKDEVNGNIPGPDHRKIAAYFDPMSAETHGTHTAGTLAGKRVNGSLANAGVAYEARIAWGNDLKVAFYFDTPLTLKAAFLRAQDAGAWIHSNSWGDDGRTSYTYWCRDIDEFLWENEEAVVVFAATNEWNLRSPENAKNSISVVAADSPPFQEYVVTGGVGPTSDGRRKPDIVAPGRSVVSARAGLACNTTTLTGTSMAAPAVAASAALVRQYFREGFYPGGVASEADGFIPSGPLIKAVLLNGTADMIGHAGFPGNREGWGRLLLDQSLYFAGDARRLLVGETRQPQGLTTGEVYEFTFLVDSDAEPLAVTMTWYDPPAAQAAATAWINNLDLEVISPTAQVYRGNVFSSGFSATGGTADGINNVEQVRLNAPMEGEWTLRITATNVPVGPQGFAWAVSGAVSPDTTVPTTPTDAFWIH